MKVICVVGARPNFMKIAPLVAEFRERSVDYLIVHTGQHYDEKLSKVFFDDLQIPKPDLNLEVGSGSRDFQIEEIKKRFRPVVEEHKPDLVLVVGDVNSTIACASVAKEFGVKVAHVEAGLRSFDMSMPEEHNRIETDAISDFLFITEKDAFDNLKKENISDDKIFFVGNVMIDNLVNNIEKASHSDVLDKFGLKNESFVVVTLHRPSNVDVKDDLLKIVEILDYIQEKVKVILPLHPRTRKAIDSFGLWDRINSLSGLIVSEPLGYLDFLKLVMNAKAVLTDSGGIQEETTYLKVPCITMRFNTERPVTVSVGSNVLVGNDKEKLVKEFDSILNDNFKDCVIPELWDGGAAKRIVDVLLSKF